jgi:hypothetical protein
MRKMGRGICEEEDGMTMEAEEVVRSGGSGGSEKRGQGRENMNGMRWLKVCPANSKKGQY